MKQLHIPRARPKRALPQLAFLLFLFGSCSGAESVSEYALIPPPLPEAWLATLGEPLWQLEWIDENGVLREKHSAHLAAEKIMPFQLSVTPIFAAPYWPEKGVRLRLFKEAGALFPLDAADGKITLSWQGGVEAHFYRLLSIEGNGKRLPQNFDWKRFRELFSSGKVEEEACANPWLADWEHIARKTAESGFLSTRIKAAKREAVTVIVPAEGPWAGTSPFAPSFTWEAGQSTSIMLTETVVNFFCPQGVFRCAKDATIFRRFAPEKPEGTAIPH